MTYQPIDSYGLIGDLRTVALVGMDGSVGLLSLPHFDSPTIVAGLLDQERGGRFVLAPDAEGMRHKQMYLPDTNVLVTSFLSEDGICEITDFMPVEELHHAHRLVRRVRCLKGPVTMSLDFEPAFDYGRTPHLARAVPGGALFEPGSGDVHPAVLRSTVPIDVVGGRAGASFTLESDQEVDFVLESVYPGVTSPAEDDAYCERALSETIAFWRHWVARMEYTGRWREMVTRSALTLKLLCSRSTGGIAAAATFGLPEEIGGERNWDYRFTWIRDGSLTAATLTSLGFTDEASAFMRWVKARYDESARDGALQIMYGIDGRHDLTEETLDDWEGYMKSSPVRIGNGAYGQLQIDIYGELMLAVDAYDQRCEPVSHDFWEDVTHSVNWVTNNWRRTDEGIWEVRGGQREFLYSRLMSWVALDRGLRIAARRSLPAPTSAWAACRDDIYREIYDHFWNEERGAFVQYKGAATLDASCLLMPMLGFVSPTDPRWLSTLDAIGAELVDGSFVYRYRTDAAAADGLSGSEGTFTMCSFWFAECLARAGRLDEARLFFEKLLGFSNHVGLFGEELSPGGVCLGNYPQAFTHLGLVNAARALDGALTAAAMH